MILIVLYAGEILLKNRTHFNSEISYTVKYYPSGKL